MELVNASKRFSAKTGETQAVPKGGRGAPAGHAKNYKNQMAQGLDGQIWVSRLQNSTGTYKWKQVKVTN